MMEFLELVHESLIKIHSHLALVLGSKILCVRDPLVMAKAYVKRADKILYGNGDCTYRPTRAQKIEAVLLISKTARIYKRAKYWRKAGVTFLDLSRWLQNLGRKDEAAEALVDAAVCFSPWQDGRVSLTYLVQAMDLFNQSGKFSKAAGLCKDFAEFYESIRKLNDALFCYEMAADFFRKEDLNSTSADECWQKVAQLAAILGQYQKATEIYEERAQNSLNTPILKDGVKENLLNAGNCQRCKGDVVAITNALKRYQELDPSFSGSRENKLLADIAIAISINDEDVARFTDAVNVFDSMTTLEPSIRTVVEGGEEFESHRNVGARQK